MFRRFVAALALALVTARCADHTTVGPLQSGAPHFLRWAGSSAPKFRVSGSSSGQVVSGVSQAGPLSLDRYSVSFWAVRGEARSTQINYLDANGNNSHPFLSLTITDPATLPGGAPLAEGDSVLVTVTIDTTKFGVSLEPTGLTFGEPAQMQMWYGGADGDLNGDGVVNAADTYTETQLLGIWYQEGDMSAWERVPATQLLDDKSFIVALPHFSRYEVAAEYAVSW
ncbi:MAG TPA: hypothetical protein VLV16_03185 [Gemmatimonadales bacterium]|nr:hypothetical protein [Gemmatimonadales bacterium]